jgi:hypothetical protein
MKTNSFILAALGLVLGTLHAQTGTVPPYINYQGRVTDNAGVGLGTGTPVNRKVIFRIFDAPTAGARLWSEQHTVTIANGEFSVLLGNGTTANFAGADETPNKTTTPLDTVFTSSGILRYVEIVVDNGDNTLNASDTPILPRQQITSTAYSFRARSADTIAAGTSLQLNGSANYGLGYYGATRQFNGTPVDGPVLFGLAGGALGSKNDAIERIALKWDASNNITANGAISAASFTSTGTFSGNGSLLTNLNASNISGMLADAQLSTNIPRLGAAATFTSLGGTDLEMRTNGTPYIDFSTTSNLATDYTGRILMRTTQMELSAPSFLFGSTPGGTGNVGIGTPAPNFPLSFPSTVGDKIALWGASGNTYGFGVQGGILQIHTDTNASDVAFGYGSSAAMTETVRIKGNGNVGIGNSSPTAKLNVGQNLTGVARSSNLVVNGGTLGSVVGSEILLASFGAITPNSSNLMVSAYRHTAGGDWRNAVFLLGANVDDTYRPGGYLAFGANGIGIGTVSPEVPLHVGTTAVIRSFLNEADGLIGGWADRSNITSNEKIGIVANNGIQAASYYVTSDVRIKNIIGKSDASPDLATLMNIEITDYRYKDTISEGNQPQKKVIAQQVEKVYPQAVSSKKGVVPDIYKKAAVKEGWVMLTTDLKVGDRVRLISEKEESIQEVLEIRDDAFLTAMKPVGEKVFVYGREVTDFRTVDYDAISMLNVSATQQIKHEKDTEIQGLRNENAALKAALASQDKRVTALEARDQARDAKIASIEKLLGSPDQSTTRTISLKAE